MSFRSVNLLLVYLLGVFVAAQDQSILRPTAPAPKAAPLTGGYGYTYIGCWNETIAHVDNGGARALDGGKAVGSGPW